MIKIKVLLVTALVAICLVVVVLFFREGVNLYDPRKIIDSMPNYVDMRLTGIQFTEVTEGSREWSLKADTMRYLKKENLIVFDRVSATFYAQEGPVNVSGDKGYYDREAGQVRLMGQVEAVDSQGNNLTTSDLRYDVETRMVHAPGQFELLGPKINVQGRGLSVDTKDNYLKVVGRSTLVLKDIGRLL